MFDFTIEDVLAFLDKILNSIKEFFKKLGILMFPTEEELSDLAK